MDKEASKDIKTLSSEKNVATFGANPEDSGEIQDTYCFRISYISLLREGENS
jgi:hypothetical protein